MFSSIFDELFSFDWNEVKNELEKNFKELDKSVDNYSKDGNYHSVYKEWKNGELVKKDDVEYKNGKLVKDDHIDNSKKPGIKNEGITCTCKKCENGKEVHVPFGENGFDLVEGLRRRNDELESELDIADEKIEALKRENNELKKKFESIKGLL